MNIQIYSVIWPYILKCCTIKLLWIYAFVVVGISCYLLLVYKGRKEDLRKCVLSQGAVKSIHEEVTDLKESLQHKQHKSGLPIRKVKANKKASMKSFQKNTLNDLKRDVMRSEEELLDLENEIESLSRRRENVKHEIAEQQKEYDECMQIFLEN